MKTTHYNVVMSGDVLSAYQEEHWPDFNESMLPRLGECIRSVSGVELTVVGVVHQAVEIDCNWTHVVELKVVK